MILRFVGGPIDGYERHTLVTPPDLVPVLWATVGQCGGTRCHGGPHLWFEAPPGGARYTRTETTDQVATYQHGEVGGDRGPVVDEREKVPV